MACGRKKLKCGLFADESVFGWVLHGPVPIQTNSSYAFSVITMLNQSEKKIEEMCSLQALEITDKAEQITQQEQDYQVKDKLQKPILRGSYGRYNVMLPRISYLSSLPTEKAVAEKSFVRATEKLLKESSATTTKYTRAGNWSHC